MAFNFSEIQGIQMMPENESEVKAPIPADAIPQERITGDVLRGYGPRRGNLERLLRYWRPIMRKPGGFRRCRVILANHPELYPLNNICAWLHHETTGLWPNEGCHHPGMKNCRRKIRGVVRGSLISDEQFENRLRRLRPAGGKGMDWNAQSQEDVVTYSDFAHAMEVLRDFMDMEQNFVTYLRDDNNWEHGGDDDEGNWTPHARMPGMGMSHDKDCGCGG